MCRAEYQTLDNSNNCMFYLGLKYSLHLIFVLSLQEKHFFKILVFLIKQKYILEKTENLSQ